MLSLFAESPFPILLNDHFQWLSTPVSTVITNGIRITAWYDVLANGRPNKAEVFQRITQQKQLRLESE
jgi:hypothetical protein